MQNHLNTLFAQGKPPAPLDGFYRGELLDTIPGNRLERFGLALLNIWLPWKGKWFDERKSHGDNIVPFFAAFLIRLRYGSAIVEKKGYDGYHTLPFRTTIEKGINDPIEVMKLDYDLPENPPLVRTVVDELVQSADGTFLGKAYLKEETKYRLVAFFRLKNQ